MRVLILSRPQREGHICPTEFYVSQWDNFNPKYHLKCTMVINRFVSLLQK